MKSFWIKKGKNGDTIKNIRNCFKLNKENKWIHDRIIRGIRNLSEQEKKGYYKPVRGGNFWNRNYIEYGSNKDGNIHKWS